MQIAKPVHVAGWQPSLELGFERRGARTALASRRHDGPLMVQKPRYAEGESICHVIVVHPPAGIAGGDTLALHACVGADGHALLTTPGAAKWYRSAGPSAQQTVSLEIADRGCVEWLPQESIVFGFERSSIDGGGTLLDYPAGLAGHPVAGTMIATLDADISTC